MSRSEFKKLPSCTILADFVSYRPDTGELHWLEPGREYFRSHQAWRMWIGKWTGKPAFSKVCRDRYFCGNLLGQKYYAHRIAWKIHHQTDPQFIDHLNGNGFDNRIENLRSVSVTQNARNKALRSDNSSGAVGVQWDTRTEKWRATIFCGKRIHLGVFDRYEDAVLARKEAGAEFGFGPNHGAKRHA